MANYTRFMPEGFVEFAATHAIDDTAAHYGMHRRTARKFIEQQPIEWQQARQALMLSRVCPDASNLPVPDDFILVCQTRTITELRDNYSVGENAIRRWLAKMPRKVLDARQAYHRAASIERGKAAVKALHEANKERLQAPDDEAGDRFAARYAEVAARNGWRVWQVAA
jgi:hypothetical protein